MLEGCLWAGLALLEYILFLVKYKFTKKKKKKYESNKKKFSPIN